MKTVLITSDFFSQYELYRTADVEELKDIIRAYEAGEDIAPNPDRHQLIGSQDEISTEDAKQRTDEIIYFEDIIS